MPASSDGIVPLVGSPKLVDTDMPEVSSDIVNGAFRLISGLSGEIVGSWKL